MNEKKLEEIEPSIRQSGERRETDNNKNKIEDLLVEEAYRDSSRNELSISSDIKCENINKSDETSENHVPEVIEKSKILLTHELKNSADIPQTSGSAVSVSLSTGSKTQGKHSNVTSRIKLGHQDDASLAEADWSVLYSRLNEISCKPSCSIARISCNGILNRYTNILPNDATRVRLVGHPYTDYINANYVEIERAGRRYVMTQGPLSFTCGHFWYMAWQLQSPGIVMLNRMFERDMEKCYPYYPSSVGEYLKFGQFKVTCESREDKLDYVIIILRLDRLILDKISNSRFLTHFQHKIWPDFGVPDSPGSFLSFLYSVRASSILDHPSTPPIIHCSAGVGRSGTFVLIDSCLCISELEHDSDEINIQDLILEMRDQRFGCIQSKEQFKFSYQCVIHGVKYSGAGSERDAKMLGGESLKKSKRPRKEQKTDIEAGVKRQKQMKDDCGQ